MSEAEEEFDPMKERWATILFVDRRGRIMYSRHKWAEEHEELSLHELKKMYDESTGIAIKPSSRYRTFDQRIQDVYELCVGNLPDFRV